MHVANWISEFEISFPNDKTETYLGGGTSHRICIDGILFLGKNAIKQIAAHGILDLVKVM